MRVGQRPVVRLAPLFDRVQEARGWKRNVIAANVAQSSAQIVGRRARPERGLATAAASKVLGQEIVDSTRRLVGVSSLSKCLFHDTPPGCSSSVLRKTAPWGDRAAETVGNRTTVKHEIRTVCVVSIDSPQSAHLTARPPGRYSTRIGHAVEHVPTNRAAHHPAQHLLEPTTTSIFRRQAAVDHAV
jgi:hypothetical protein